MDWSTKPWICAPRGNRSDLLMNILRCSIAYDTQFPSCYSFAHWNVAISIIMLHHQGMLLLGLMRMRVLRGGPSLRCRTRTGPRLVRSSRRATSFLLVTACLWVCLYLSRVSVTYCGIGRDIWKMTDHRFVKISAIILVAVRTAFAPNLGDFFD